MTVPRNITYRKLLDSFSFEVNPNTAFNEGDLMMWDTGTKQARPIADDAESAFLLGEVYGTNPVKYHGSIKTVAINITRNHTVKLIAREVGAFDMGTPVYFSTDAQSFCLTDPGSGEPIGYLLQCPKEQGSASGTTVIGDEYEVLLRDSYIFNL